MQFCRAGRPAESADFVLAFRPHSDLLAKMSTVSVRLIYSTAGLLDYRVNRPASKPVRTYRRSNVEHTRSTGQIAGFGWALDGGICTGGKIVIITRKSTIDSTSPGVKLSSSSNGNPRKIRSHEAITLPHLRNYQLPLQQDADPSGSQ